MVLFKLLKRKPLSLSLSDRHLENISLNISLANKCNDIICCTHIQGRQNIEKFNDVSSILYIAIFSNLLGLLHKSQLHNPIISITLVKLVKSNKSLYLKDKYSSYTNHFDVRKHMISIEKQKNKIQINHFF